MKNVKQPQVLENSKIQLAYSKKAHDFLVEQAVRASLKLSTKEKLKDYPEYALIFEMIHSFQPENLLELTLACQYVVMHFHSYKSSSWEGEKICLNSIAFSHKTLEMIMRVKSFKNRLAIQEAE